MHLHVFPWVLVLTLCCQCTFAHVLQRRMEGLFPSLAKSSFFKGIRGSTDDARQLTRVSGTPHNPDGIPELSHASHLPGSPSGQRQLTRSDATRFNFHLAGQRQLTRNSGARFDLQKVDNAVGRVELLQEIDAILARSHNSPHSSVPKSLKEYEIKPSSGAYDTYENQFEDGEFVYEEVTHDPIYLDVIHSGIRKVPQRDLDQSYSQTQEAGRILTALTPEHRTRQTAGADFQQTVDVDFMVREFRTTWLKHIPQDKQTLDVSHSIHDVSKTIKRMVVSSKKHAETEKLIAKPLASWKAFDSTLGKGLQEAVSAYAKDQTGKAVVSQLEKSLKNWHSPQIQQLAQSTTGNLLKDLDPEDITRMHTMVFSGRQDKPIAAGEPKSQLQQFLVDKLGQVPNEKDEEFKFILEGLSTQHYASLMTKSNVEIATLTPEEIAAVVKIEAEDIMHLKVQFAIVNPSEKAAGRLLNNKLDSLSRAVAGDLEIMKAALQNKVHEIVQHTNYKVETQLFKRNFGIELSSAELAGKMKDLGKAWNPDLRAFERDFKAQLLPEEYDQLSKAAAASKELYAQVLASIKETRKIDRFRYLEDRAFPEGHRDPTAVLQFVQDLEQKGIIDKKLAESLFESGKSTGQATPDPSAQEAVSALSKLHKTMQIDLFDKLEIRSIPQLPLSDAISSIIKNLDELKKAQLITPEERDYFFPLKLTSAPIAAIEDYAANIARLRDFSALFRNRLEDHLNSQFAQIPRDAPKFRSSFLTKYTEIQTSDQKEEIDALLIKKEYANIIERLRPESIEKNLQERLPHEFVGEELWDDYFSREYSMYKIYPVDQLAAKVAENPSRYKPRKFSDSRKDLQNLKNLALSKLSAPESAGHPAGNAASSGKGVLKTQKTDFPDERHFALVNDPLKPMKTNGAQQTPPLADARFKDTAFRYLDKSLMDEWNASVDMIASQKELYQQNLIKRDLYDAQIQNAMESLGPYSQIVGKIFREINSKFSVGFSESSTTLYKLTPKADDPRVTGAFIGHRQ
ncbi:hypothetical protein VP01_1290g4 [Puccinia sorghi]|uniref:Uncharacterized protein n=1 Tax=Puccinia sorghi TaxID=27349 RepID=A0A0L6VNF3_9BASI|nr:hypothetical protein VP01_1290g4 [Puccinia sorghi]